MGKNSGKISKEYRLNEILVKRLGEIAETSNLSHNAFVELALTGIVNQIDTSWLIKRTQEKLIEELGEEPTLGQLKEGLKRAMKDAEVESRVIHREMFGYLTAVSSDDAKLFREVEDAFKAPIIFGATMLYMSEVALRFQDVFKKELEEQNRAKEQEQTEEKTVDNSES